MVCSNVQLILAMGMEAKTVEYVRWLTTNRTELMYVQNGSTWIVITQTMILIFNWFTWITIANQWFLKPFNAYESKGNMQSRRGVAIEGAGMVHTYLVGVRAMVNIIQYQQIWKNSQWQFFRGCRNVFITLPIPSVGWLVRSVCWINTSLQITT